MLVFVLSLEEKIIEIENLGFDSCKDIKVFDKNLSFYQEACLECGESFEKIIVKNTDVLTFKKYVEQSDAKYSVFFYENCFFDFSVTDILEKLNRNIGFTGDVYEIDNKLVFSLIDNEKIRTGVMSEHFFERITDFLKSCCLVEKPRFYYTFLNTYTSYKKLHFDILNGKTNVYLPNIAKGIFTHGKLPKGDYMIIPPVYISENSQIENGSVIGPCTVVSNNSLIAKNSRVSKCVVCENSFISEECIVENSICGKNSSVKRGAAILNDCVLCYDSLVGDGICIKNRAVVFPEIQAYSFINDVKRDIKLDFDRVCFNNLDVVSACKLGACFGNVFNTPSICVASDENNFSKTVKLAFISGLCASGCDCIDIGSSFLSKIFYTTLFCQLDYCFYFSLGESNVSLEIYDDNCEKINIVNLYNLLFIYRKQKREIISPEKVKKVNQIKGLSKVYLRDLKSLLPTNIINKYKVSCDNLMIEKLINILFKTMKSTNSYFAGVEFYINGSGDKLTLCYKNKSYFNSDLINVVDYLKIRENTGSLISNLYKNDALVLLIIIVSYVDESEEKLQNFITALEKIKTFEREYGYITSTGKFLNKFLYDKKIEYKNGKLYIINKADNFLFNLDSNSKKIKIISKFSDVAASEELFRDLEDIIDDINKM